MEKLTRSIFASIFIYMALGSSVFAAIVSTNLDRLFKDGFVAEAKVQGELCDRPIVEKYLPILSEAHGEEQREMYVEFQIDVLPDGTVDEITHIVQSSGNEEYNLLADEALRLFKFTVTLETIRQTGTIRFTQVLASDARLENRPQTKYPLEIYGELKDRKRLKIALPKYPRWAEERGLETEVALKLCVNPEGRVINVKIEKSSGYGDVDQRSKQALKGFVFAPLPDDEPQTVQEGTILFYFRLSK